jgi:hypothetical protein
MPDSIGHPFPPVIPGLTGYLPSVMPDLIGHPNKKEADISILL